MALMSCSPVLGIALLMELWLISTACQLQVRQSRFMSHQCHSYQTCIKCIDSVPAGDDSSLPITKFIQKRIPAASLVENIGMEMTYQLPNDQSHMTSFETLFQDLDANLKALGLSSYGVSDTTLEEVFLKVACENEVDHDLPEEDVRTGTEQLTDGEREKNTSA